MTRLNSSLLAKIAHKKKTTIPRIRQGISHRASRWRITSEAAQLVWADQMGISIGGALARLPPHVQEQVREHGKDFVERPPGASRRAPVRANTPRGARDGLREAVNRLITEPQLVSRCADTLKGTRKFDRAINQATLVLESYLRKLSRKGKGTNIHEVAAIVLHPKNPVLRVSTEDDVQEGYFFICKGLFLVFRNLTHHQLAEFSREDAISICGFVNAFLDALRKGALAAVAVPGTSPFKGSLSAKS